VSIIKISIPFLIWPLQSVYFHFDSLNQRMLKCISKHQSTSSTIYYNTKYNAALGDLLLHKLPAR